MLNLPIQPLSLILRTLPNNLHSEFVSRLFNHLLRGQWVAEQLQELNGKVLSIVIADSRTELIFLIRGGKLYRSAAKFRQWDVRIKGKLEDFWLLATRREDPDTLFFNRRLSIEGDTETGLHVKNMLDALEFDWEAHLQDVLGPGPGKRLGQLIKTSGLEKKLQHRLGPHH